MKKGADIEKPDPLSEDSIKRALERWLRDQGWEPKIAWGRSPGIDVEARRGPARWVIEAKGRGVSPQAQGNYFLGALAELVQRMTDANCRYSLAFPDLARYQGLGNRLPALAKSRLQVSVLFIDERGNVIESGSRNHEASSGRSFQPTGRPEAAVCATRCSAANGGPG